MGIDAIFLPIECDTDVITYSHSILRLERNRALWDEINKLEPRKLGKTLNCYLARREDGETQYGEVNEDNYGEALTYLYTQELALIDDEFIEGVNKAVWGYLKELPPSTKIVIFWS